MICTCQNMYDKKTNMSKSSFMLAIACAHASTPATDLMRAKNNTHQLLFILKFLIVSFLKKKKKIK